jgi:TonB family protein
MKLFYGATMYPGTGRSRQRISYRPKIMKCGCLFFVVCHQMLRLKLTKVEFTMKRILLLTAIFLTACGPSTEEKRQVEIEQQRIEKEASEKLAQEKADRVAAVTCSIMSETRNMDGAVRVEKMNEAREKIGGEAFLRGDDAIKEAFQFGLCSELVLNENYDEALQPLKDAKRERERIAREKELEELRIAREKELEELRIAREKRAEETRRAVEERKRIEREDLAEAREKYEEKLAQRMQPLKENHIPTFVPEPKYPSLAINRKMDGYGLVRFNINESGNVARIILLEEWPEGLGFGESALRAAKDLKYEERGSPIQGVRHKFIFKQEK